MRKRGLFPAAFTPLKKVKIEAPERPQQTLDSLKAENERVYLQFHHPSWEILEAKWTATCQYRNSCMSKYTMISEIVEDWPKYEGKLAPTLVIRI
jgi:hypothetical protein